MLNITIDPHSGQPPYEQVRDRIIELVTAQQLVAGYRLPPVRALASQLTLAANTVARAYKELEAAGVVETRGRAGTFISAGGVERTARAAAVEYVATARVVGRTDAEILSDVRRALAGT